MNNSEPFSFTYYWPPLLHFFLKRKKPFAFKASAIKAIPSPNQKRTYHSAKKKTMLSPFSLFFSPLKKNYIFGKIISRKKASKRYFSPSSN